MFRLSFSRSLIITKGLTMSKLSLLDIKQSLHDERFRNLFPEHHEEIAKFIHDPGCACNTPLLHKLLKYKDRLQQYFPTKEIGPIETNNHWKVINCHVDELEKNLRKLNKLPKQVAVARWQDQVTVVIHEV